MIAWVGIGWLVFLILWLAFHSPGLIVLASLLWIVGGQAIVLTFRCRHCGARVVHWRDYAARFHPDAPSYRSRPPKCWNCGLPLDTDTDS